MKALLYKEFKLALHPAALLFVFLSALLLIPAYPFFITFFYQCLGIFFICMAGRENRDVEYTALLPVKKRRIVLARVLFAVFLQLAQVAAAALFAALRPALGLLENAAGMDANAAFFGVALLMLGVFNLLFFTAYYRNTNKVGVPFLLGCIGFCAVLLAVEASAHAVPFVRDCLDGFSPACQGARLAVLGAGGGCYALLTWIACRTASKSFERLDL